jgi:hypothetical protein
LALNRSEERGGKTTFLLAAGHLALTETDLPLHQLGEQLRGGESLALTALAVQKAPERRSRRWLRRLLEPLGS